ncbi:allophanate hydrolase [Chthonobacter rhizosphaerae]|uniref:allophanate hydrolase n=1 Tax=Chthonobacter rhizosphaerae TaxID=2735553 RepID=UPI0015EE5D7D|nr:allophanate hydrolase [Chthonobacter rhizosphaerae]
MTILALDLARLRDGYENGLTPADVIEEVYRRIEACGDPGVFLTLVPKEDALAAAAALGPYDPARPLYGVPFAVKDNIDVAGLPTTAACPDFAYRPAEDAAVVARLKAAGAIVIGKTNLDQFATGLVGVRTPFPVPRNAIDPALVPGGSSSGSAVAVALGLVSFALGTDTAGSGRVPAGLNNIVGLKPSVGAVSTRGVVPACRTLDCVSVFAGTVPDAHAVFSVMAAFDAADPYSRPVPLGPMAASSSVRIGVPMPETLRFFGDTAAETAFAESVADLKALGCVPVPVDLTPFFEVAALLYEGAWVAERYAAIESFITASPDSLHPVTRSITLGGLNQSAVEAFKGFYRLAALKRAVEPVLASIDCLVVPTFPSPVTLEEIAAEPVAANSRLGTYTNFVNLLDLAALAIPGRFRPDGRPAGVTLIGRSGTDGLLAALGAALHGHIAPTIGATGLPLPKATPAPAAVPDGWIRVAVVGAHLSGMPLNPELTRLGARFVAAGHTAPDYRLYALAGGPPFRPGLSRVEEGGASIALETWVLPPEGFGRFVAGIPAPLGIGTVTLVDGSTVKGFICEAAGLAGAVDITVHGGWRAYLAAKAAAAE